MSENSVPMIADMVIVGGGMVGSLLAAALASTSLKIVIIDAVPAQPMTADAPFEPRVSAISRASENMLRHVGAWDLITCQQRHCEFTNMQVWEYDGKAELHFSAQDVGAHHLGCLLENRLMQWGLTTAAQQADNVSLLAPAKVTRLERLLRGWCVELADGTRIHTPLVVGADGAFSLVRKTAAIGMATWDYQQQAIVCTIQTERPHQLTARQVFLPTGPLALLPLAKADHCSIVWSVKTERAKEILALDEANFCQALTEASGAVLGQVLTADQRHAFPLMARHAESYHAQGLVLIGDAAHTIHPLAGQGVNLGFLDAAVLAEEIRRALSRRLPVEHPQTLARYSLRRRAHNALIMHSMTGLERIYAAQWPWLTLLRNDGVSFVNRQPVLRRFFEQQAMGLQGDLPALAKNSLPISDFYALPA